MVSEIKVIIKDDEKRMTKKFLIYDPYHVSEDDPIIKKCIEKYRVLVEIIYLNYFYGINYE